MKLGFEETQLGFSSGSQQARVWTERWVADQLYCPSCGKTQIIQFGANRPVADFYCASCQEQFELKSQKKRFGTKVLDGAFQTKRERLLSDSNPNLLLLNYNLNDKAVRDVCVVPKHFFTLDVIEERPPLSPTARRAGWVGSNILLSRIPDSGKIYFVRDGTPLSKETVLSKWRSMLFLREQEIEARGWLLEVLKCVESLGKAEFNIGDVYAFEDHLGHLYPNNNNVRPKIRQKLQVLRDHGYLDFLGNGHYRLRT